MSITTPPHFRRKSSISFKNSPTLTEQSHRETVKIQNIMAKYKSTGLVTHLNAFQGTYSDMVDAPDYHTAQNLIADANSLFETIPSHIRAQLNNDAGQFLEFIQNPKNREQIEDMGLDASHLPLPKKKPKPSPTPTKDNKTPPAASPEDSAPS